MHKPVIEPLSSSFMHTFCNLKRFNLKELVTGVRIEPSFLIIGVASLVFFSSSSFASSLLWSSDGSVILLLLICSTNFKDSSKICVLCLTKDTELDTSIGQIKLKTAPSTKQPRRKSENPALTRFPFTKIFSTVSCITPFIYRLTSPLLFPSFNENGVNLRLAMSKGMFSGAP